MLLVLTESGTPCCSLIGQRRRRSKEKLGLMRLGCCKRVFSGTCGMLMFCAVFFLLLRHVEPVFV